MGRVLSTSEGTHAGAFGLNDWVLFLGIGLIWGSSFLLIAIGLNALAPGAVTWIRVGVGALVLQLVPGNRGPLAREDRARVLAVSVLWVGLPFTLFPLAQQWVSSSVTGMLNGGVPIVTAVIATILLRRLPGRIQIAGLLLGLGGVVTIALTTAGEGSSQALGVVLLIIAVVCYGLAINLVAPLQRRYGATAVMRRMLALATIWTAPFGLVGLTSSRFSWGSVGAVVVLGAVGTGLAFLMMSRLVGRVGGTRASFVTYLIPVVALVLGVTLRGETVSVFAVAGIVAVIAGALLASRADRRAAAAISAV
jgi:drug/metabolite transporter (DMT)-like permease